MWGSWRSCIERDLCILHFPPPPSFLSLILLIFFASFSVFQSSENTNRSGLQMGNCQAVDAAALVIQHPCGKIERLYYPVTASEVMKMNPGHYVSLIIPLPVPADEQNQEQEQKKTVRFTRVKLLRPNETLNLGHAYRLITTQEVVKVLKARKNAKTKRPLPEVAERSHTVQAKQSSSCEAEGGKSDAERSYQAMRSERQRQRTASANSMAVRTKSWRPSLQIISESGS